MHSLVGLSGNLTRPSRTRLLVEKVAAAVEERGGWQCRCFDLLDAGSQLGTTLSRNDASPEHARIWDAIVSCDALVIGSPVYKASYTGLLKHLLDLIDPSALAGKPVIVAATGKAPQHALVIDHQFRPLMGFFGAWTMPTGIYATDADFAAADAVGPALAARIAKAADELATFRGP